MRILRGEQVIGTANVRPERASGSEEGYSPARFRIPGPWLLAARLAWLAYAVSSVILFLITLPTAYRDQIRYATNPAVLPNLTHFGLSPHGYALLQTMVGNVWAATCLTVAVILFCRRSDELFPLFVATLLVPSGNLDWLISRYPAWHLPITALRILMSAMIPLFFYLFPDGRFVPRWTRWLALYWAGPHQFFFWFPQSPFSLARWSPRLYHFTIFGLVASFALAQVYRYRRVSGPIERQQTKWIVLGVAAVFVPGAVGGLLSLLFPSLVRPGTVLYVAGSVYLGLSLSLVPLSIGVAVLRYRLWDVDPILNRTIVYGLLTATVIGMYMLMVGGLSTLLQAQGNLAISLLATGIVAVLFQPLRERLQRGVNRLMYGDRDEPYTVITRLGQRLKETFAPEAVLPTVVRTVKEALKLPYVAIAMEEQDVCTIAAAAGEPPARAARAGAEEGYPQGDADLLRLPLVYQHETVGHLFLAPRAPGELFSPADRRLLDDLAHQAGIAVHAVRLTTDLQRSRERLVTAQEEERRRLRRDLHDGLGPALAAQTLKVGSARYLLADNPTAADRLLAELENDIDRALEDVRQLVYNLRPPALDELGLLAAIQASAAQYAGPDTGSSGHRGVHIAVDAPAKLPSLPAAVEVAAYRIVQEALTNVVRHARARNCRIQLAIDQAALSLEIRDDGVGLPRERHVGVGLQSIRERAEELGGMCLIEPIPAGGTRVHAHLPIPPNANTREEP